MSGMAYTREFASVERAEREWIAARRAAAGLPPPGDDVTGLAFSGGGIRSATFNLGVLQALERYGLMREVDYLSSVSGGGYIASSYSWLRATTPRPDAPTFEQALPNGRRVVDWLRAHGKFLVAHRGFSMATLAAAVFAATLLNLIVLGPPLLLLIEAATLGWLPLPWPHELAQIAPQAHNGYWLLIVAGLLCFVAFLPASLLFAVLAGRVSPQGGRPLDRYRMTMGRLLIAGVALIGLGTIPIVTGVLETLLYRTSLELKGWGVHLTWLTSLGSGALATWRGSAGTSASRQRVAMLGVTLVVYALMVLGYAVAERIDLLHAPLFAGALVLSIALGVLCNLNAVSMHGYYRDRLSQAYMPALVEGARPREFGLAEITPARGQPLHLINTTLNTTSSHDVIERARCGAAFCFSPLYSGSTGTGWLPTAQLDDSDRRLATACTISGAAVDPDTAATRQRALSMLMALFNLRLGYWARNPAPDARRGPPLPPWWLRIGREMFGVGLDARRREIHLSDGGGFENLGLYELVRRRVRRLIVVDAGYDPGLNLADLGAAIERVRVDFGAEIRLAVEHFGRDKVDPLGGRPYLLGSILYADGSSGRLLYLKPMLCPGLSADIYAYWRSNPQFPNEPTSNQFFDEPQFEAYRRLGLGTVDTLVGESPPAGVAAWFDQIAARGRAAG
jgi:hypothetical protein